MNKTEPMEEDETLAKIAAWRTAATMAKIKRIYFGGHSMGKFMKWASQFCSDRNDFFASRESRCLGPTPEEFFAISVDHHKMLELPEIGGPGNENATWLGRLMMQTQNVRGLNVIDPGVPWANCSAGSDNLLLSGAAQP